MSKAFESVMQDRFDASATADPVLVALFHAFALHINDLYDEAESSFPGAVLDDLLSGLSLAPRAAQPAQTVIQFSEISARALVTTDVTISGFNDAGEPLVFAVDHPIEVARARLVFAGVVSGSRCRMIPGAVAPTAGGQIRTSDFVVRGANAAYASLFLAFETDYRHLSNLGLMLQVPALNAGALDQLSRAPWILLGHDGTRREPGVMRSVAVAGGVRQLEWVDDADGAQRPDVNAAPPGPFGGCVIVFPDIPEDRRWKGAPPAFLRQGLAALVADKPDAYEGASLAWVEVLLPAGTMDAGTMFDRVMLNCISASNLEVVSERLEFAKFGTTLRTQPEGLKGRHLLGVLSVIGADGDGYVSAESLDAPLDAGRYRIRQQMFEVRPHKHETGRLDKSALARLRFCDGAKANNVKMHQLNRLSRKLPDNPIIQASNVVATRAGAEPPAYADARVRFADLVRSRERIVTSEDVEIAVRACEPRARTVEVQSTPRIRVGVLGHVDDVVVGISADTLADPDAEGVTLAHRIQTLLAPRWMLGRELSVRIVVVEATT